MQNKALIMKASMIIFDVNETLLDISNVKKKVNKALSSKRGFKLWFGLLLQYSLVDTVTNNYHDFATIANATLTMAAQALETEIKEDDKKDILNQMKDLSPHKDVKEGLTLLKDAGYRLVTLTNSPPATLQHQLQKGGLSVFFEAALSVDEFRMYKPHVDVYKKALEKLGVQPQEAIMVAAHGWDIAGALAAGMQAAFIERKGHMLYPLAPKPHYISKGVVEFAQNFI